MNFGGLFADGSARWVVKDNCSGCPYTVFVGVLGAFTGGFLMSAIDSIGVDEFSILSVLVAALGAALLLLLLQEIFGRTAGTRR
ncbi:MAG: GlsB/YeaQ/YmgE family stress response membrane protein [Ilumatobacter sp.]|nr:GlsB/YeaQ/YmgE family stress response membrane protein [Ilumatobacter sp.]